MRLFVRLVRKHCSPEFSRATHCAPDGAEVAPLSQPANRISEQFDSTVSDGMVAVKKKRKLSREQQVAFSGSFALPPVSQSSEGILTFFPFESWGVGLANQPPAPFFTAFASFLGSAYPQTITVPAEPFSTSAIKGHHLINRYCIRDLYYWRLQSPSQGNLQRHQHTCLLHNP